MNTQATYSEVKFGAVVKTVITPACHAGGRGFESLPFRQYFENKGLCSTVKVNKVLFFQAFSFRRCSWLTIVEHAKLGDLCRSMYRFCLSCLGRLTPTFTKSYNILITKKKTLQNPFPHHEISGSPCQTTGNHRNSFGVV